MILSKWPFTSQEGTQVLIRVIGNLRIHMDGNGVYQALERISIRIDNVLELSMKVVRFLMSLRR